MTPLEILSQETSTGT